MDPNWLRWSKELQAIAQNGLTFSQDVFDIERYQAVRRIASEMMATQSSLSGVAIAEIFGSEIGYATPKVDVRGAVFRGDGILLVREKSDGRWSLPGGWADVNYSPSENLVREIEEEAGLTARVIKLVAVLDRSKHPHIPAYPYHVYKLFFLCEAEDGAPQAGKETSETGFFRADSLPDISLGRVLPSQIERMFVHNRQRDLPAEFD